RAGANGKPLAAPADGVPELAHLAEDAPAGLLLPLPHPPYELLAPQVVAGQTLLGELALDDVLGGDAGMVGARKPERLEAAHARTPDQRVLDRVIEGVPDMQRARDVGRRQDDA